VKVEIFDPTEATSNEFMIVPVTQSLPKATTTTSASVITAAFQKTQPERELEKA
jgi:hypothetical protein